MKSWVETTWDLMRCLRIQQGRLSWMTVDQTHNAGIMCPLEIMSGTWSDCSSQWWHRTFVGKPSSVIWFQLCKPFPRVWALQAMSFNRVDDKSGPFWASGIPQRDRVVPLVVHSAFGKLIHPNTLSLEGVSFPYHTESILHWRGVQMSSSSLLKADNLVLKLSTEAEWLQCTYLPHYLQISRT